MIACMPACANLVFLSLIVARLPLLVARSKLLHRCVNKRFRVTHPSRSNSLLRSFQHCGADVSRSIGCLGCIKLLARSLDGHRSIGRGLLRRLLTRLLPLLFLHKPIAPCVHIRSHLHICMHIGVRNCASCAFSSASSELRNPAPSALHTHERPCR